MAAYYNENDTFAAAWLRELIKGKHIADGDVDERSITEVSPEDVRGYTQSHWFAGIGGWSYALRLAGWPDDRAVWTGSCPCQPFSTAGKQKGTSDARHLWPIWHVLIAECRPPVVFGEQVEAAINHGWLDLVQDDLERENYAVAAVGLPAAGVGAPHIRQRLWFVADDNAARRGAGRTSEAGDGGDTARVELAGLRDAGREVRNLANNSSDGLDFRNGVAGIQQETMVPLAGEALERARGAHGGLADGDRAGVLSPIQRTTFRWLSENRAEVVERSPLSGHWRNAEWLRCADDKLRPVEPGTFPLAHGAPVRVGRLRGYGNAIVPQVAAEVIKAFMSCRP